jgi:hypothetical protein
VKDSKNNKGKEGLKEVPSTSISENIFEVCIEGYYQILLVPIKMVLVHLKNIQKV